MGMNLLPAEPLYVRFAPFDRVRLIDDGSAATVIEPQRDGAAYRVRRDDGHELTVDVFDLDLIRRRALPDLASAV